MDPLIGYRIFIAFIVGIAIGIEREVHEKTGTFRNSPSATLGIRTFSLITVLGALMGVLYNKYMPIALLISGAFVALLLLFYFLDSQQTKQTGITTETALLYSFVIGLFITLEVIPVQMTLAITIGVLLLLSQKNFIKTKVSALKHHELNAFLSFAIIALVILPFLPNSSYAIADIPAMQGFLKTVGWADGKILAIELINPFKLWMYVALITGVDLIGYLLERVFGSRKGWLFASAAGGFVSSTATTQSLAQESKKNNDTHTLLAAAILANLISFLQIGLLVLPVNIAYFFHIFPILITMLLVSGGIFFYFLRSGKRHNTTLKKLSADETKIIDLKAALQFALLFLIITAVSKIALLFLGNSGFLLTSALGAFAGLDAVIINAAQLIEKNVTISLGVLAFVIANAVNLLAKVLYSFSLGSREFAVKLAISMGVIVASSVAAFFLF